MTSSTPAPCGARSGVRTYVLDTSVLLADPQAVRRFDEHEVVLPIVVLAELEAKRHHPELGWAARRALRLLEDLRLEHGSLTEAVAVNPRGGTVRIELNHADLAGLPEALRGTDNDHRILAVARNLAAEGADAVVVSKDLPLRLRASVAGLGVEEYRNELAVEDGWTGWTELEVSAELTDHLSPARAVARAGPGEPPCHTGLVLQVAGGAAPARPSPGCTPTSGPTWCGATATCSTCGDA